MAADQRKRWSSVLSPAGTDISLVSDEIGGSAALHEPAQPPTSTFAGSWGAYWTPVVSRTAVPERITFASR
jgi:hypothetical protein